MVAVPAVPTFAAGQKATAATLTSLAQVATYAVARPCCIATRTTNQTIANVTRTSIVYDTESFDNAGLFTAGASAIVITYAGVWEILSFTSFASNATGMRWNAIYVNGVSIAQTSQVPATGGNTTPVTAVLRRSLIVGDSITTQVFQSSGGNLDTTGGGDGNAFMSALFISN